MCGRTSATSGWLHLVCSGQFHPSPCVCSRSARLHLILTPVYTSIYGTIVDKLQIQVWTTLKTSTRFAKGTLLLFSHPSSCQPGVATSIGWGYRTVVWDVNRQLEILGSCADPFGGLLGSRMTADAAESAEPVSGAITTRNDTCINTKPTRSKLLGTRERVGSAHLKSHDLTADSFSQRDCT